MANNYFLTGLPKSGKTTILRRLANDLQKQGYRVGGFLSPEMREHGTRKGFAVEDIATGKSAGMADEGGGGPRVGRYHVDVRSFESVVMPAMANAYRFDVVFIDEIGAMELESVQFADALADLLQTDTPVVASLGQQYITTYEIYGTIYRVNEGNRSQVYGDLLETLSRTLKRKPAARLKFEEKGKAQTTAKAVRKAGAKAAKKKTRVPEAKKKPEKREGRGFFGRIRKWLGA